MLRAIVLQLDLLDGLASVPRGYQAHALFLNLLRQVDSELSAALHDAQDHKPYTVSLESARDHGERDRQQAVFLRVTTLDDVLFVPFIARLAGSAAGSVRLGSGRYRVARALVSPGDHPRVGAASFEDLLTSGGGGTRIEMEFVTPTSFSLGKLPNGRRRTALFPEPALVFDSLLHKWNRAAPVDLQLDTSWRPVVEGFCMVTSHALRTAHFPAAHSSELGFVGRCGFEAFSSDPQFLQLLQALSRFAEFSGVGSRTTMGMGQVRCWRPEVRSGARPAERSRGGAA